MKSPRQSITVALLIGSVLGLGFVAFRGRLFDRGPSSVPAHSVRNQEAAAEAGTDVQGSGATTPSLGPDSSQVVIGGGKAGTEGSPPGSDGGTTDSTRADSVRRRPGKHEPMSPAGMLRQSLGLTEEQGKKAELIFKSQQEQLMALRRSNTLSRAQWRAKCQELHQTAEAKLSEVLKPEQAQKWQQMRTNREAWGTLAPAGADRNTVDPVDAAKVSSDERFRLETVALDAAKEDALDSSFVIYGAQDLRISDF